MEKKEPPAYTEQPMPQEQSMPMPQEQPMPMPQEQPQPQAQSAQARIIYTPAQTYQPYPGGPTQPPLYPPMAQHPAGNPYSTVVIHHTTTANRVPVGKDPTFIRCPSCQTEVVTSIQMAPTGRTHLAALLLCLVGCWPCVCVPYCMDSCKQTNHYCPACNAFVGKRNV